MKNITECGFKETDTEKLGFDPFEKIGKEWMLVAAGNESALNTMTASWGFTGVMWGQPCAVTVIRPQRYTKEFIDKSGYFTLSFFDESYRQALALCGRVSGRDTDKISQAKLTPVSVGESSAFEQASLVLYCRKLYAGQLQPSAFIDKSLIDANYSAGDFHTAYIGQIVKAYTRG